MLKSKKYVRTITRIPDDLWSEITNTLPEEKPDNTMGHPLVPYRKVFDGILFVLRTDWMSMENVTQSISFRFYMA
jgi:hypothetical protein